MIIGEGPVATKANDIVPFAVPVLPIPSPVEHSYILSLFSGAHDSVCQSLTGSGESQDVSHNPERY